MEEDIREELIRLRRLKRIMGKRFILVDGSSLLFRAFYALPPLETTDGVQTGAVHGFLNMFYRMLQDYEPDYLLVAFDESGPTVRTEKYEDYKGHREKAPDELSFQFPIVREIIEKMNIVEISSSDYEADDIIGTMSKKASEQQMDVLLFTGDQDYLQLIDDHTDVLLTRQGISNLETIDLKNIRENFDLTPSQLIDMNGFQGDPSDNIPGVPGIGEKTALSLIQEFGSMDDVYENIDKVTGKKRVENLIKFKEQAYLSKELFTIIRDMPLELTIEDCAMQEPDVEGLRELFQRYELNTFLSRLPGSEEDIEENFEFSFNLEENLEEILKEIEDTKEFHYDFIFNNENYIYNEPSYFSVLSNGKAYIQSIDDLDFEAFKKYFESKEITKVNYNSKKNINYLLRRGIEVELPVEDISLMEYIIDTSVNQFHIHEAAQTHLNRHVESVEDILGRGVSKKKYEDLNEENLGNYLSMRLHIVKSLVKPLLEEIHEREMDPLYYEVEIPLAKVLAHMEYEGIYVDREVFKELKEKFSAELNELTGKIHEYAGKEFNVNSPKQLGEVLFEDLKLPVIKKTKTGYSTAQDVLEKLQGSHEIIDDIMRYRSLSKLISTYIDGFEELITEDDKIHTTFYQNLTATGRLSSRDPNLQNIPIRTEEGRQIRRAFISSPGNLFLDADYSQIELRVLAHLSEDKNMIKAFLEDKDIHAQTASQVFNITLEDVTPLQRDAAKAVNFGIVYGVSDYGLSQNLDISRKEAKEYIDKYLENYSGVKKYMDEIVEKAKEDGYVETILHRRRYIPEIHSKNFNTRSFGERVALNTPIQGSAADIIKIAMVRVFKELKERNLNTKLLLQIHDELMLDVPEEEVEEVQILLERIMEEAQELKVPLKISISTGKSWYE